MGQTNGRGAPLPNGSMEPVYDIIAPRCGERMDVVFLESEFLGVNTHWVVDLKTGKGQSRACEDWRDRCVHCGRSRKQWLGFIAVYQFLGRRRAILRAGPETVKEIVKRGTPFAGITGMAMRLARGEEQRTGALTVEVSPFAAPIPLPRACRLEHTLRVVLGTDSLPEVRHPADEIPLPEPEGEVS